MYECGFFLAVVAQKKTFILKLSCTFCKIKIILFEIKLNLALHKNIIF